ncbi:fructokinase [Monaibacterium marinum]|uniref:Fructokinase n=1 Tax=Pontivivens marinum TaxID=1690039 RepID=A0A2C9CV49_9RHOB|nr:nucleoside/nucleotide kinase family protein [Monaibacterium marinum]SOH95147.1 fructokinase [Monaibacterium marinum]
MCIADLTTQINAVLPKGRRRLIALAGAPASGKSTLADDLANALGGQVVPMDGFHLDNSILSVRNLLHRKGAPETFDASGILHLVQRLAQGAEVVHPTFDRHRDIAIAGSGVVGVDCTTVVIEGNYLLHDAPIWRELSALWDFSIRLDVPMAELRNRLVQRWLDHGLTERQAIARAEENDLPNARLMAAAELPADATITSA